MSRPIHGKLKTLLREILKDLNKQSVIFMNQNILRCNDSPYWSINQCNLKISADFLIDWQADSIKCI